MALISRIPSAHRSRLLATSADLFWVHGYRATTTRRIAATLGLQQATLYHHVSSKEDLLYEICVSSLSRLLRASESALAGLASPRARFDALVRTTVLELVENQREHATMIYELRGLSPERRADVLDTLERYRALLRSTIEECQQDGTLRTDVDAVSLELAVFNLLSWLLVWYREGQALTAVTLTDLVIEVFLHGAAADRDAVDGLRPWKPTAPPEPVNEATRTAQRITGVAAALFRAQGYEATTAREIAAVLGIQKASLYHHTKGKADLLHQICTSALREIRADVEAAITAVDDPLARARALVVTHVTSLLRRQDHHATSLLESRALSGSQLDDVVRLRDEHESCVREAIEAAQRDGALRADIPAKYLSLLLFSLTNRSMLWYKPGGRLRPEQFGDLFAVLFLGGASRPGARSEPLRLDAA